MDESELNNIAAIVTVLGSLPLLFWVYKKLLRKVVRPVIITLSKGEVFRSDSDDFVGLDVRLIIKSNNHNSNTIHELYPLVVIAGRHELIIDVFINGRRLNNNGHSHMYEAFTVNDEISIMTMNGSYDIDKSSDFKKNLTLTVQYSINNKPYNHQFELNYVYLG